MTCTSDIEVDGETFAARTTISTLTTNSEGKASTKNNLPVGYTYVLTETKAPTGYVMSNKNTTIELKEDTTVEYVTVNKTITNKPTSVEISKTDITDGKLIEGAKLEIREGNKVIDSWTSSASEAHKFTGVLEAGKTYTLVETYAPDGYVVSQSINFTVNKDGTINKVEMKDERAKGNIHIQKRTEFNTDIEGIKFIISGTSILGEKVNIEAITDANGEATIENVPIGTYIITEDSQTVPYGYFVADEQSVKVTNNNTSDVTFDNKYQYGTITVYKTDSEDNTYFLAGAKFNIIARDDVTVNNKQYKSGDVIETITTNANGKAITTKLYPVNHTYKVTEIKAPDGYVITTASKNVVLSFNSAVEYTNADVNFNNDRQTGTITIYKVDANNREIKLEGAVFDVIADDDIVVAGKTVYTKGSVIETITTDSTGKATTSAKLYSGFSYLLKETKAPDGYIQENTEKKIFMFIDANVKYVSASETIENKPTKIYVSKRDIYGDELKGAEMQLINESGTIIDTWTSDGTNHVVTNLKKGKYTLKEVASPTGYVIATNITFTIDEYNKVKVEGVDAVATTEDGYPIIVMVDDTTKVQFKKLDENGNPIDGAELELYDESGKLVDSWNSDTYYIEKELKAGMQYTLHEVSAPDGYVLSADVDFTVSLDGKLDTVNMIDKSTKVKFSKKSLTGDDEVVGATLQVYDADGNLIDEWVSTTEPHYVIAEYVAGAKYTLKETVVPKGYVKAKDIDFTVSEDGGIDVVTMYDDITKVEIEKKNITDGKLLEGATLVIKDKNGKVIDQWVSSSTESHKLYGVLIAGETYTLTETASPYGFVLTNSVQFKVSTDGSIDKCTMINEPQYGQVTITKKGKVFTSVKTADDKTIIPVFEDRGLNGVEYDIVAVEDIYVGQSLVVKKGSVVDHLVTDENGKATSQNLFVGKYNLIETKTASGYYLDPDNCTTPIEIVYNKTSQIADTVDEALYNDKQKISISFLKAMVKDEEFGIGMNGEEANVIFGLYANERLTAADGKTIEANDLIDTVQLKVGTFESTFSKDVPFGEYYVKEIATDGKYILNETKYLVTISPQQQTISSINISANDGKPIINDIKRGTIKIQKKTEDMLNISDIEFILSGKAENGTEIVQKATTDENGVAEFKNIPIGIYTVSENGETVPTAYLVANAQEVTVFYSQETTAEFINEEKTGSVKVKKSTVEDKFISGIAFSLTGKTDTGRDISIISLTDENGIAEFNNIPIGTYTITEDEETVNEAYIVAEPQDITVNYNEVTEVSITNAEKTGYVKIQKTTEEMLNVEGIEFILLGTSDTGRNIMQTAVTDEDGFAQFDNVPTGVYSIIENGETVPTAYLIADEQTVEVKYEEVSTVTVENKERKGRVEVQKKTEGMTDIEGIKFFLSGTSDSGRKILIESVTNSEGIAVFENIPIGSYIISEDASTVSAGYLTAKDSEVIVETEKTTTVEIKNDKKKGKISITKVDAETGEVLKGCDFEILDKDMNLICTGTTDDKGLVEFELAYGEYYYRETKAPDGYVLDDSLIAFTIEEEGQMVEIEVSNNAIPQTGIIFKGMSVEGNLAMFSVNFSILMFMFIRHIKQAKKKEYK